MPLEKGRIVLHPNQQLWISFKGGGNCKNTYLYLLDTTVGIGYKITHSQLDLVDAWYGMKKLII